MTKLTPPCHPTQPRPLTDCGAPFEAVSIRGRASVGFAADGDFCNGEEQNMGRGRGGARREGRGTIGALLFYLNQIASWAQQCQDKGDAAGGWVGYAFDVLIWWPADLCLIFCAHPCMHRASSPWTTGRVHCLPRRMRLCRDGSRRWARSMRSCTR